jgi:hypothetical protein
MEEYRRIITIKTLHTAIFLKWRTFGYYDNNFFYENIKIKNKETSVTVIRVYRLKAVIRRNKKGQVN